MGKSLKMIRLNDANSLNNLITYAQKRAASLKINNQVLEKTID